MRVIYYSYWGTYAAFVAASIHTGLYPADRLPPEQLLSRQWEICRKYGSQFGNLLYIGLDEDMKEVYCLGCKGKYGLAVRAIENFNRIFGIDEPVHFISTRHCEGMIPFYVEKLRRFSVSDRYVPKLLNRWIARRYDKCLMLAQRAKQSLKGVI